MSSSSSCPTAPVTPAMAITGALPAEVDMRREPVRRWRMPARSDLVAIVKSGFAFTFGFGFGFGFWFWFWFWFWRVSFSAVFVLCLVLRVVGVG